MEYENNFSTIEIPKDLKNKLKIVSSERNITMKALVIEIVEEFLKKDFKRKERDKEWIRKL